VFTSQYDVRDSLIKLGTGRNGAPILTLRRVEIRFGKTWYSYITSVLDPAVLPPYVVADLYRRRWRIEEMFRDFKSGAYNLEDTNVSGGRLISLISLIAIAYTFATISGQQIKHKNVQEYVGCVKQYGRTERRHSSFYIGLYGQSWVSFMKQSKDLVRRVLPSIGMTCAPKAWAIVTIQLRKHCSKACGSSLANTLAKVS
jgi:hypothetical protein